MGSVLGVDIGGTSAKLGLVDAAGRLCRRAAIPTGTGVRAEALVEALSIAAAELAAGDTLDGVGVAAPGFRMDNGEGVENVSNLPGIDGFPLRTALEHRLGCPAVLDNDANAAAMGEHLFGGGRDVRRLLVLTLGTGIGAGMVADGAVVRTCCGGLGDPGHIIVDPGGERCACGGRGCAEATAAVPAILRHAAEYAGRAFASPAEVVDAARSGDPGAHRALQEAGRTLGMVLATLTHVLGPERILLGGGGFDAAEELLFAPARETLFGCVQPFFGRRLTLGRATLGNDAGVIGAAALLRTLPGSMAGPHRSS